MVTQKTARDTWGKKGYPNLIYIESTTTSYTEEDDEPKKL